MAKKKRSVGSMYVFDPAKKRNVLKPSINKKIQSKRRATIAAKKAGRGTAVSNG